MTLMQNRIRVMKLTIVAFVYVICTANLAFAANNEAFVIELKSEPKTIGDIKPTFIVYKDKPLPKVTINSVLKRYIKLFETANSPDVRIDALNRINNLREKYKLNSKKLTIDKVKQSQVVLDSYDRIIDSGVFYQRMDELLYQTAKATKFVGNDEESIKRLKLLVGLYPRSELVDESMFRMAEAYFDLHQFNKAEAAYKKILAFSTKDTFHKKAKFKLAWTLFRLDRYDDSAKFSLDVLDQYPELNGVIDYEEFVENEDYVTDTLRLMSILFSKQKGSESIEQLQTAIGHQKYAYLFYDSLFRFYLKHDRYQESAVVARNYTLAYPNSFHAYKMGLNSILSYRKGDFDIEEWAAKEHLVNSFGLDSNYWSTINTEQAAIVRPILVKHIGDLAHSYFIKMQSALKRQKAKSKRLNKGSVSLVSIDKTDDYRAHGQRASDYYIALVKTIGFNKVNSKHLYIAAEALSTIGEYAKAIKVYERAAYEQFEEISSVKAGYAAILTFDNLAESSKAGRGLTDIQSADRRASIERFTQYFPAAQQTPALLNELANELFVAKQYLQAEKISKQVLEHRSTTAQLKYASLLVNAHSNFELKKFHQSELAYISLLTEKPGKDVTILKERLAASIYKQAEFEADIATSAELYLRVVDLVPSASIVPQSLYDASTLFLQLKKWRQAIATLNSFQQQFPKHSLYNEASDKLIFAYLENSEPVSAAEKLVQVSNETVDSAIGSNSLYRAAEIYQENDFKYEGVQLFASFTKKYPTLFALNIEARQFNVDYYDEIGQKADALKWRKSIINFEKQHSVKSTDRSSYLAANASLNVTLLDLDGFNSLKLTLPLKKSLKAKTVALKKLISKFQALSLYQVAEIQSASTYQIGLIYRNLAQDLINSERPQGLSELELEQYNILLEEEAFPFEEQAFDIFKINISKVPDGEFDKWIELTYQTLSVMNPTEYKRKVKVIEFADEIF
mgnify:CR=1 FL=1